MKLRFTLLLLITLLLTGIAQAQSKAGTIKGKLTDSISMQSLKDATVTILDRNDSSVLTFGISKVDGNFTVENIPFGTHLLLITFQGYKEIEKEFMVSKDLPIYSIGNLFMLPLPKELAGVTVKTPPITIKGDTTEFNAEQFKTKPNSTAEDLLKKLPGIEVSKDGTVKAQGEDVKRVLVDGKRFFGDDPKMATRNLPTDVIDKIQVFDAQSDQSAFSGFDDGNREKTINIITKKDKRKGYFGKGSVGAGDNERYSSNLSVNKFNGNQQISLIAQANNTNNQDFSIQDILGTMNVGGGGGGGGRGGGGGGITNVISSFLGGTSSGIATTRSAGLNYNDVWSKKTSVSGSYFYNNLNMLNEQDKFRETFVAGDSSLFSDNLASTNNKNHNHRFNFEFNHKIDSMNTLLIRPSLTFQETDNFNETNSYTSRGKLLKLNDVQAFYNSASSGYTFNNSILYRHRFQKNGRSFSVNFTQGLNNTDINATNISYNNTFRVGRIDTLNQQSSIEREGKSYGANVSYTEPMGTKGQLEFNYIYSYSENNSDQQTLEINKTTKLYDKVVSTLTNNFENTNTSHRTGISYRRNISKEWNYTLGMATQFAELNSDNLTKTTNINQHFVNYFPTVSIRYSKNRTKNLRFTYRGNTRQPSVTQLQDVIDNSNVLNIKSGNPALKQEFSNNLNLFYGNFDIFTFKNFFVSLNGTINSNKIGNSYFINSTRDTVYKEGYPVGPGAQFSKPVNLDGAYNVRGFLNYGFPLRKPKSNINLTTNVTVSRDVNLVNDIKSFTNNYVLGETVRFTMNYKERLDLNFSSTSTYTFSRYSNSATTNQPNGDFFTQIFSVEPTYSTKSGWIFGSDFDYILNRGQSAGFNQSIPLWTASIAKTVLKKKQAEIKLSVFDLLNQNKSISRNVEQNYVEDVRSQVLNRYFMLTFTYNLRSFKGQENQPASPMNMKSGGQQGRMRF